MSIEMNDITARIIDDQEQFNLVLTLITEKKFDEAKRELSEWYKIDMSNEPYMVNLLRGNQYFTMLCNILMIEESKSNH